MGTGMKSSTTSTGATTGSAASTNLPGTNTGRQTQPKSTVSEGTMPFSSSSSGTSQAKEFPRSQQDNLKDTDPADRTNESTRGQGP
jgi:hypothetical protein